MVEAWGEAERATESQEGKAEKSDEVVQESQLLSGAKILINFKMTPVSDGQNQYRKGICNVRRNGIIMRRLEITQ